MSQRSRHSDPGSLPINLGLIITPMLDMSFQILSFFIMVYNPSSQEGHITGTLVPPSTPKIKGKDSNVPTDQPMISDTEPDLENTLQVIVKSIPKGGRAERGRDDGQPTQIYVKYKEDRDATLVADIDDPSIEASLVKLQTKLKATAGEGLKNNVRLECHGDLKHQYVMALYDACKAAGYQNVQFVAPLPDKQ